MRILSRDNSFHKQYACTSLNIPKFRLYTEGFVLFLHNLPIVNVDAKTTTYINIVPLLYIK